MTREYHEGYQQGYKDAKEEGKEPTTKNEAKYCDRNICINNEYNNVGCEDCEVTKSQEPTTQERQAESDKFDAAFQDGYDTGYAQARFDYEQEPRKGHWGWLRCDMYVCSECKNVYTDLSGIKDRMNYCPNCGSRNEVEE